MSDDSRLEIGCINSPDSTLHLVRHEGGVITSRYYLSGAKTASKVSWCDARKLKQVVEYFDELVHHGVDDDFNPEPGDDSGALIRCRWFMNAMYLTWQHETFWSDPRFSATRGVAPSADAMVQIRDFLKAAFQDADAAVHRSLAGNPKPAFGL